MSVSEAGGPTLARYTKAFTDAAFLRALGNTAILALWVGVVSVVFGAPMAWLCARTDLPGRRLLRGLILASFVTPPFLGAFAWVMLAGPNAGAINRLYRDLTGATDPLVDIFTMTGLVFVVSLYTLPYVFIMLTNTLQLIASDLEEAAAILGAPRTQVALTVTLPMIAPALASGFILALLQAIALFGSPAILALPAGFHTIPRQHPLHFSRVQRHPRRRGQHAGAAIADRLSGGGAGGTARLRGRAPADHRRRAPALPRPRPRGHPRRGDGRGTLPGLHAPTSRALRDPVDPLHRLRDEGDAGRLFPVRGDLPFDPSRAGRRCARAGSGTAARPRRRHGPAGPERDHRHLVLRLHRGHP